jgi:sugar phosphate isomerase/epimerase
MKMGGKNVKLSVFTKPWRKETVEELGGLVAGLGFDGMEFPLRPGYQVEPANAEKGLPELVGKLDGFGLKVYSVASSTEENVFAGCAASGIPLIRIMAGIDQGIGYVASEEKTRREIEKIIPLCEKYGIKVGVQMHCGWFVKDAMQMMRLIGSFDPRHIGAVWDVAHGGLAGEEPEMGLDICWSHLCMVNLKNAFYLRQNGPEAAEAEWSVYWTTGGQGLGSWSRTAACLKAKEYEGVVCLTNEYSDEANTKKYIADDIRYAKSLLG